jgi:UDP-N-acetylmuramoyl-tripeptide--D-alanyl-D-alanine ligase
MNSGLWTAYEAAAATGGALCARGGDPSRWIAEEWAADGISIDTRTLQKGEIFVALKDIRDGHEFVAAAFEKGAAAALVARAPENTPSGAPLLVVPDTLEALRDLARNARLRNFGKRIGVTGSAGKTSTKEMLRAALGSSGSVHASDKSYNNHWGVPLSLARLPMHADFAIFEIGMNHAGEITPLTDLVRPHVAVVTTIAPAHIENFGTLENIARAKGEIFGGLERGGSAVIPRDVEHFDVLRKSAETAGAHAVVTFGKHASADLRLDAYEMDESGGVVTATVFGEPLQYRLGAPGLHQAMNSLAVLAASTAAGVEVERAAAALATQGSAEGRGARKAIALAGGGQALLIDESYNANPASMAAALQLLAAARPKAQGRRIAVLGEMLELGAHSAAMHESLLGPVLAARVERLYVSGPAMRHLWDKAPTSMKAARADKAADLVDAVKKDLRDGDVVMVKGSNGSKVHEIARALASKSAA